jgi:hypothetical protein
VRPHRAGRDWVNVPIGVNGPFTVRDLGGYRLASSGSVYLYFWGSSWRSNPPPDPSVQDVVNAFAKIVSSPYQSGVAQYGCSMLRWGGAYFTTGGIDPPSTFHDVDIQTRMMEIIDFNYSAPGAPADLYFIITGPGAKYSNSAVAGAHSYFADLRAFAYMNYAWVQFGSLKSMTTIFSHELVEGITDPHGDGIQIDPTDSTDWNEIGDACEGNVGLVNGVQVQAYWSRKDNVCVIPQDVQIRNRQITCIKKGPTATSPRDRIKAVGGISVESGQQFFVTQEHCIRDIDAGMRYFTIGADGSTADVRVNIHFPKWVPKGSRYIATVPDNSKNDNLLVLPQCKTSLKLAEP